MTAIGQTIAVSMQVAHGLGRHTSTLSSSQIADYDQAEYASQILYISATSLAKLAVLQFLTTLARKNLGRLATKAVMAAALVWSLVAILSIAFQCSLPHPWAITSVQCFDQVSEVKSFDITIAYRRTRGYFGSWSEPLTLFLTLQLQFYLSIYSLIFKYLGSRK